MVVPGMVVRVGDLELDGVAHVDLPAEIAARGLDDAVTLERAPQRLNELGMRLHGHSKDHVFENAIASRDLRLASAHLLDRGPNPSSQLRDLVIVKTNGDCAIARQPIVQRAAAGSRSRRALRSQGSNHGKLLSQRRPERLKSLNTHTQRRAAKQLTVCGMASVIGPRQSRVSLFHAFSSHKLTQRAWWAATAD